MKTYLGYTVPELKDRGAYFTASEISHQPLVWEKTFEIFFSQKGKINSYLREFLSEEKANILLVGAGSSAFIGEVVAPIMQKAFRIPVKAAATTDIVTHPEYYVIPESPTLVISFARSGNSPESVKTVELINALNPNAKNIIITCNEKGKLAKMVRRDRDYIFLLPDESNDQSLAMTSSFTSMLLTAILMAGLAAEEISAGDVEDLAECGRRIIDYSNTELMKLSRYPFERAVFLGSGPMQGIARESHLKLQELSDGKIICKFDTFLGFRHGPKAVIDDKTLLVYLFSRHPYIRGYEEDLAESVKREGRGLYHLGIAESGGSPNCSSTIIYGLENNSLKGPLKNILSVIPAQILAFHKSMELGLMPDSPSESGAISRVVEGVKVYPYKGVEV